VQLLAVGYVLAIVFTWRNPYSVIAVILVMLAIATVVARNRIDKRLSRLLPILAGSLLTTLIAHDGLHHGRQLFALRSGTSRVT
jgi:putative ABC transport system permease protein